jgi:hypothetical protein
VPVVILAIRPWLTKSYSPLRAEDAGDKNHLQRRVAELEGVIREASCPCGASGCPSDDMLFLAQK